METIHYISNGKVGIQLSIIEEDFGGLGILKNMTAIDTADLESPQFLHLRADERSALMTYLQKTMILKKQKPKEV